MLRKARVLLGEVLPCDCRERRRRKRAATRLAVIMKTRNVRTAITTCSSKTACTVSGDEVKDMYTEFPPKSILE
jgi:hypothetical protein